MKTRKLKEEEKEQDLTCLCHIIDDIMACAKIITYPQKMRR